MTRPAIYQFPEIVVHCDWSTRPEKRWMAVSLKQDGAWNLALPEPVGETSTIFHRLQDRSGTGARLLAGFDFSIGLPSSYGRLTGLSGFREALREFGSGNWSSWYDVAETAAEISLQRPFYPMRPGGTARRHLFEGLGITEPLELLRLCERATGLRSAACMLFWTLGGNQVGKAAIAGWREVIAPNLERIGLWPFDGSLPEILDRFPVAVVETYPGDAYGQIGIPRYPRWSKRLQEGRRRVAGPLLDWIETRQAVAGRELLSFIEQGFSADGAGEDQFDAMVGLMGMLDVVDGRRADGAPDNPDVRNWEGWIFGQAQDVRTLTEHTRNGL